MEPKPKRKLGRPRTLPEGMEKFTVSMSPLTKRRLTSMATLHSCPAYVVIERALAEAWKALPEEQRFAAETLVRAIEQAEESGRGAIGAASDPAGDDRGSR